MHTNGPSGPQMEDPFHRDRMSTLSDNNPFSLTILRHCYPLPHFVSFLNRTIKDIVLNRAHMLALAISAYL